MEHAVEIEGVSKSYGKKLVLEDIGFLIGEGMIYGLIGPSGSGKTTLVKMIVGITEPDAGAIHIFGVKVPNLELLEKVGYMAQADALYTELTGKENLDFFASLYPMKSTARKKRIAYAAGIVNLTAELGKRVSAYSGGMKRRLSLAIALVHNPKLLILDEPTVGMDPELRLSVWTELLHLKKEHQKTIIITTHVMDEAERCDIVSLVREGRILATGTPTELKQAYGAMDLEEVFLKAGREHR
ncbi:MAG TPA: ABC transporter ATP-binding protein [Planococcus sp. (in: firmicutes)]|nr:ABC transporter ATP-binding protein [Planococcus sp. (in: firmicutes)]